MDGHRLSWQKSTFRHLTSVSKNLLKHPSFSKFYIYLVFSSESCWPWRDPGSLNCLKHISGSFRFTEVTAPQHVTCIMTRCARTQNLWLSNAWRMAEFQQRSKAKSYPLPDLGIRHRCMMTVPMCWPERWLQSLWHSWDFPLELQSQEPWTRSSQVTTANYLVPAELHTFFLSHCPSLPSREQSPDTLQSHSPVKGNS